MKQSTPARTRLPLTRLRSLAIAGLLISSTSAFAQTSGTWTSTTGGNWSDIANWNSGSGPVATGGSTGANVTATFSASGTQTVNLDSDQTVQTLAFSTGTYTLSSNNGSVLTLAGSSTPVIASSGTISLTLAGTQGFNMTPGGIRSLNLSGNNTYTGVTTMSGGGMIFAKSNNALGATGTGNGTLINYTTNSAVQLHILNNVSIGEDITLQIGSSGTTGANLIFNDSGNNTLSGNITLGRFSPNSSLTAGVNTFGVQSTSGTLTISGNISGSTASGQADGSVADQNRLQFRPTASTSAVSVTGVISDGTIGTSGLSVYTTTDALGMVRLSGANTYSGSTVHQKGTMLINNTTGSGTGTGSVSVSSTATFGGTGIIKPAGTNGINFASGSIVAPGDLNDSGAAIAAGKSLTFDLGSTTGSAVFASGATISINLNAAAAPAEVSESLAFIGLTTGVSQVTFNGNVVNFSITGGLLADGLYTIASFSADNAYTGQWVLGTGLESLGNVQLIQTANSIQLAVGAIPEPASAAALAGLLGIGAVMVGKRRRSS